MHTQKIVITLSIFCLLFASAWYVHAKIDRHQQIQYPGTVMNDDPSEVEISEYRPYNIHDPDRELSNMLKPFAPREYIRIRERWSPQP